MDLNYNIEILKSALSQINDDSILHVSGEKLNELLSNSGFGICDEYCITINDLVIILSNCNIQDFIILLDMTLILIKRYGSYTDEVIAAIDFINQNKV